MKTMIAILVALVAVLPGVARSGDSSALIPTGLGKEYDEAKYQLLRAEQEYKTAQSFYQPGSRGLKDATRQLADARRALARVAGDVLEKMRKREADLQEEYDVYLTEMKPEHPQMQDLAADITDTKKAVEQLQADIAAGLGPVYVCNIDEKKRIDGEFREDVRYGDGAGKRRTYTAYFMTRYQRGRQLEVFGDNKGTYIEENRYLDLGACRFLYKSPYLVIFRTDYGTKGLPQSLDNYEELYDQYKQLTSVQNPMASFGRVPIADPATARQTPVAAVKVERSTLTEAAAGGVFLTFTDSQGKPHEVAISEKDDKDFKHTGRLFIDTAWCDMTLRCDKEKRTVRVAFTKMVEEDLGSTRPTREYIKQVEHEGWSFYDIPPIRFVVFNTEEKTYIFLHRLDLGADGVPQQHDNAQKIYDSFPYDKEGGVPDLKWRCQSINMREEQ